MGCHAAIGTDIDFFSIDFFEREFSCFEDERIHRCAHVGRIEKFSLVVVDRAVAAAEAIRFVGSNISGEGHRLVEQIDRGRVGEDLKAVVAFDFDRSTEDDLFANVAAYCAAEIFDVEFLGNGATGIGKRWKIRRWHGRDRINRC